MTTPTNHRDRHGGRAYHEPIVPAGATDHQRRSARAFGVRTRSPHGRRRVVLVRAGDAVGAVPTGGGAVSGRTKSWLVARREWRAGSRSTGLWVRAAMMPVVVVAAIVVPALVDRDELKYDVGFAGVETIRVRPIVRRRGEATPPQDTHRCTSAAEHPVVAERRPVLLTASTGRRMAVRPWFWPVGRGVMTSWRLLGIRYEDLGCWWSRPWWRWLGAVRGRRRRRCWKG
jgi:hypothetical protein